jgi:hypothetical protein
MLLPKDLPEYLDIDTQLLRRLGKRGLTEEETLARILYLENSELKKKGKQFIIQ